MTLIHLLINNYCFILYSRGLIIGSGVPSVDNFEKTIDIAREKGPKRVGPFMVPKTMSSTCSATLATSFKIKGYNYSITSACSTSAHCIGNAYELISWGKQDVIFAGARRRHLRRMWQQLRTYLVGRGLKAPDNGALWEILKSNIYEKNQDYDRRIRLRGHSHQ